MQFMHQFATAIQVVITSFKSNFIFAAKFVGLLWCIQILNRLLGYRLCVLGIHPRTVYGFVGIFFAPFLHANFNHLFFNSIPLLVLLDLVLLHGIRTFYIVTFSIILLSGLGIWSLGKKGVHIGASSLVMGYFGYLLADAYFQWNATTIILAVVCLYYFGGLILALFPDATRKNISWEGHVFGCLAGVFVAYYYPTINALI